MRKRVKYRFGYLTTDETKLNLAIKRRLSEEEYRRILRKMNEGISDISKLYKYVDDSLLPVKVALFIGFALLAVIIIVLVQCL